MNWKQGLGPFTTLILYIKSMKCQQEIVKDDDKLIIGKEQGKVVWSTSVWEK